MRLSFDSICVIALGVLIGALAADIMWRAWKALGPRDLVQDVSERTRVMLDGLWPDIEAFFRRAIGVPKDRVRDVTETWMALRIDPYNPPGGLSPEMLSHCETVIDAYDRQDDLDEGDRLSVRLAVHAGVNWPAKDWPDFLQDLLPPGGGTTT